MELTEPYNRGELLEAGGRGIDPNNPHPSTLVAFPDSPYRRGNNSEKLREYLEGQRQARVVLMGVVEQVLAGKQVTADEFTEVMQRANYVSIRGVNGELNTRPEVASPGKLRTGYYYSDLGIEVVSQVREVARDLGTEFKVLPEVVRVRRFTNPLNGLDMTGYTTGEGVHNYPVAGAIKKYLRVGAEVLNEAARIDPGDRVTVSRNAGELHQVLAIAHAFDAANQSQAMNLANALLESRGIPGISHGITDAVAVGLDPDRYQDYFVNLVLGGSNAG